MKSTTPDDLFEAKLRAAITGARANRECLKGCPRHDFELIEPSVPLRARYRCMVCGGEVDGHAQFWYELGLAHAKATP